MNAPVKLPDETETQPAVPSPHAPSIGALTPQQLLAAAARPREEKTVDIEGLGKVLIGEISGIERADLLSEQVTKARQDLFDVKASQRKLLLASVLDPGSPEGARRGAFQTQADASSFMQLGAGKIAKLLDEIEEFSGLKQPQATEEAKKDSSTSQSDSATSD